ncbi:hypothetical protein F383_37517 [Gossypium arboreum]|uniref:Uncharacterized protein n=1 Tax=Gossypium arboreum TaxID=29729 RepID=A0A0B0MH34_GOSAR|nr:hypothetical protein F383_37517 [Gossypium arboreum]
MTRLRPCHLLDLVCFVPFWLIFVSFCLLVLS